MNLLGKINVHVVIVESDLAKVAEVIEIIVEVVTISTAI